MIQGVQYRACTRRGRGGTGGPEVGYGHKRRSLRMKRRLERKRSGRGGEREELGAGGMGDGEGGRV